jgi:hypothetical protein
MQERFCKVVGKVLKLWERFYRREKVGKVSKFQERLFNDNFKAGNGEERKGKGKLSVPPIICQMILCSNVLSKFFNGKQNFV